jgi:hypothetical protein
MRIALLVLFVVAVKLTQILNIGSPVRGITVLYERLYVLRENSVQLEVYDIDTLRLIQRLTLPGLGESYSMASSRQCSCVFIPDWSNSTMYRVDVHDNDETNPQGSFVTQWWPVRDRPYGVSVNSDGHVVVVSPITETIQVFTITGELMRSIDLPAEIKNPWHATEAKFGKFFVSYDNDNSLCMVDDKGEILASIGGYSENDKRNLMIGAYWKWKNRLSLYINSKFQNSWILSARPLELHSEGYFDVWMNLRESFSYLKNFDAKV